MYNCLSPFFFRRLRKLSKFVVVVVSLLQLVEVGARTINY